MGFVAYGRGQDPDSEVIRLYRLTDLDSQGNPSASKPHYFGYIDKLGNWYIMRLTDTTSRFTRGDEDYSTGWTNRASLTYWRFDEIF